MDPLSAGQNSAGGLLIVVHEPRIAGGQDGRQPLFNTRWWLLRHVKQTSLQAAYDSGDLHGRDEARDFGQTYLFVKTCPLFEPWRQVPMLTLKSAIGARLDD